MNPNAARVAARFFEATTITPYQARQIEVAKRRSSEPRVIAQRAGLPLEKVVAYLEGRAKIVDPGKDPFGLSTR